ncbi:unnamed protein product, partial [Acanthocheilonema viteae]
MEEFGCQNNDDIILKCAFVTTRKYENESVRVVFATNDKNLAVKAAAHNIITELLHLLTVDPLRSESQQLMIKNNQKISPSDFSFNLVDKPSLSAVKTVQVDAMKKVVDRLPEPLGCHSSSPSFTLFLQKREISSYNSSISGVAKDESRTSVRIKKESCGMSGSIERRGVHQHRRIPYSLRKAGKESSGSGGRLSKKKRFCQLNEHSMAHFLEIFAELVQYFKHRSDKKSVEDMTRINKVIDSVIANESFSLSVLVDIVSKFYDFYADRDVFISALNQTELSDGIFSEKSALHRVVHALIGSLKDVLHYVSSGL